MTKLLCIYHGGCDDGFAAALAVRMKLRDSVEFHPGVYQRPPPDVTDRHVLLVDFSYKRPVLLDMATRARSIVILDHHHTAAQDLFGFAVPTPFSEWKDNGLPLVAHGIAALFDMTRCGAMIAWEFFHETPPPAFIRYIQDRDLWRKELPSGDEFSIALRSYPQDFDTWERFVQAGPDALIAEGAGIQRYYRARVEDLKRHAYRATIAGHPVRIANAPYFAASEVAGEMADDDVAFGACFFQVAADRWQYSLRSRAGAFDVSEVAKAFGGGGHKGAAGFTVSAPVHLPAKEPT